MKAEKTIGKRAVRTGRGKGQFKCKSPGGSKRGLSGKLRSSADRRRGLGKGWQEQERLQS